MQDHHKTMFCVWLKTWWHWLQKNIWKILFHLSTLVECQLSWAGIKFCFLFGWMEYGSCYLQFVSISFGVCFWLDFGNSTLPSVLVYYVDLFCLIELWLLKSEILLLTLFMTWQASASCTQKLWMTSVDMLNTTLGVTHMVLKCWFSSSNKSCNCSYCIIMFYLNDLRLILFKDFFTATDNILSSETDKSWKEFYTKVCSISNCTI